MKNFFLVSICAIISIASFAQIDQTKIPKKISMGSPAIQTQNASLIQSGYQPFQPELIRQKVVLGHPLGTFGMGISQQYKNHPYPFSWQNTQLLQPLRGIPQYPPFVLSSASPVVSHIGSKGTIHAFSAGLLNQDGYMPDFRKIKIVKGFPLDQSK